jgi:hypothetical protein
MFTPNFDLPAPPESCHPAPKVPSGIPWAEFLRRVWDLDALRCESCGGRLHPVALVRDLAEAECTKFLSSLSPLVGHGPASWFMHKPLLHV